MNKALILVILSIILILGITTIYAEEHDYIPTLESEPTNEDEINQNIVFSIIVTAPENSDTITLTGKTDSTYLVTFRVISPSGNNVVLISQILPDNNGEFTTEFKIGQMWREDGFYTINARQSDAQNSLYTLNVKVEVIDGFALETNVSDYLDNEYPSTITVITNKSEYHEYEIVIVSGIVENPYSETLVIITVTAPNGNTVSITQVKLNENNEYNLNFIVGGALMKNNGMYEVRAQYVQTKVTTTFNLISDDYTSLPIPETIPEPFPFPIPETIPVPETTPIPTCL